MSRVKGGTQIEGVRVQGAEDSIWPQTEYGALGSRKFANKGLHIHSSPDVSRMLK
jgi:hypothetical protein